MKNLHSINKNNIPDNIKLLATRWHLTDRFYSNRRYGRLKWENNTLYYLPPGHSGNWEQVRGELLHTFKDIASARRSVTLEYYQEDMIE